jgi:anaerobic magnesium-protoporphyrin IX monomethyl ester cyclase
MRILLVQPKFYTLWEKNKSLESFLPPIGMLYLAAVAEKLGHTVEVLDMHDRNVTMQTIVRKAVKSDVVGFGCVTPAVKVAYDLAKKIKEENPSVKIISGGPHPTALPEEPLHNHMDVTLIGESDETFAEILKCFENGSSLESVDGICYKKRGRTVYTKPRCLISDLDSLPLPAYHLVDVEKYFY